MNKLALGLIIVSCWAYGADQKARMLQKQMLEMQKIEFLFEDCYQDLKLIPTKATLQAEEESKATSQRQQELRSKHVLRTLLQKLQYLAY